MTDFERILKAQANTIQFVMDRIFGGTVVAMDPMNLNPVAVDEHRTGGGRELERAVRGDAPECGDLVEQWTPDEIEEMARPYTDRACFI